MTLINVHKTMTKITGPKQVDAQLNTHSSTQTYLSPYKYDNWLISLPSWLLLKLLINELEDQSYTSLSSVFLLCPHSVSACVCVWSFDFLWIDVLLPHGVSRHLSLVES
jgi:hypothetical protein